MPEKLNRVRGEGVNNVLESPTISGTVSGTQTRSGTTTGGTYALATLTSPTLTGESDDATTKAATASPTVTTAAAVTYTTAQVAPNVYFARDPNGAARADLLPDADDLVADHGLTVGAYFDFTLANTGAATEDITLTQSAAASTTVQGTVVVPDGETHVFRVVCTNATALSEACVVFSLTL